MKTKRRITSLYFTRQFHELKGKNTKKYLSLPKRIKAIGIQAFGKSEKGD